MCITLARRVCSDLTSTHALMCVTATIHVLQQQELAREAASFLCDADLAIVHVLWLFMVCCCCFCVFVVLWRMTVAYIQDLLKSPFRVPQASCDRAIHHCAACIYVCCVSLMFKLVIPRDHTSAVHVPHPHLLLSCSQPAALAAH